MPAFVIMVLAAYMGQHTRFYYLSTYSSFTSCHAEYFFRYCTPPQVLSFNITCSNPVQSMYFQSEWKTVWLLIRSLGQKPADLDVVFSKRINLSLAGQGLTCMHSYLMGPCEQFSSKPPHLFPNVVFETAGNYRLADLISTKILYAGRNLLKQQPATTQWC